MNVKPARRTCAAAQTIVFSISGAVLAVVLVIALLFNFHVFGLGEVETPASQPNYGNAAPCAVKDSSGKAQYVSNASVGIRVMNGTSHGQFAKAVGEALANRGFSVQKIDNYSSTDVERTTIYFGKNAINQAYTLIGNFTDATMIMTAREDQLIDVVIGATFNDLQDTNSSPQSGKTITNIEGCKAADSMTKLPGRHQTRRIHGAVRRIQLHLREKPYADTYSAYGFLVSDWYRTTESRRTSA